MNTNTSAKVPRKPEKDDPYLAISASWNWTPLWKKLIWGEISCSSVKEYLSTNVSVTRYLTSNFFDGDSVILEVPLNVLDVLVAQDEYFLISMRCLLLDKLYDGVKRAACRSEYRYNYVTN